MMLVNIITLGVIVVCLLVIIFIVIKKFPKLTQVDTETLPESKEEKAKDRIIKAKLERKLLVKVKSWFKKARPLADKLSVITKNIFNKTLELERAYRKKLEPKTLQEKEKVDAKTDDLVKSGEELLAQDKFVQAERKFIDAIALDSKDLEAYQGLAELYLEQDRVEEARETFEYILKINTDNYDAYSQLGSIAKAEGNLQKARDYHLKSIALDSQAAVHYLNLAEVYQEMEDLKKAFECLEKALGLEPNNPRNLDAILNLSIIMGDKKEARSYLKKLAAVNPENQKLEELGERIKEMK